MNIVCDFENKITSNINKEYIALKCGNKVSVYTIESINDLHQFVVYENT